MTPEQLREGWKREEQAAHIHGWDFSHIRGRYEEEQDLPWDYDAIVRARLDREAMLLDYDTGAGSTCSLWNTPATAPPPPRAGPPTWNSAARPLSPWASTFAPAMTPPPSPLGTGPLTG